MSLFHHQLVEAEEIEDKAAAEQARHGLMIAKSECEAIVDLISDGKQWREEIVRVNDSLNYKWVRATYPAAFIKSVLRKAMGKNGQKKVTDYLK